MSFRTIALATQHRLLGAHIQTAPKSYAQHDEDASNASAGNRAQVTSMATMYSATRPLMLLQHITKITQIVTKLQNWVYDVADHLIYLPSKGQRVYVCACLFVSLRLWMRTQPIQRKPRMPVKLATQDLQDGGCARSIKNGAICNRQFGRVV